MDAAARNDGKAADLLDPWRRIDRLEEYPSPALDRLEEIVGGELARRLLVALAGDHRMRARLRPD